MKKDKKELKVWREEQDKKGINWRKKKTRTCRTCKLTYSTIITQRKHRELFCIKKFENFEKQEKVAKIMKEKNNLSQSIASSPFLVKKNIFSLQIELRLFDKDYIRLPTKNKKPLVKNWTSFDYREEKTIDQLLEKNGEYGIRTGKKINDNYFFNVLIFQKRDEQKVWYSYIDLEQTAFKDISYIDTGTTYHYYLLVKEQIPYSAKLYPKHDNYKSCGIIFSKGKQVIGIESFVENIEYKLTKKKQDWLIFDTIKELKEYLKQQGIRWDIDLLRIVSAIQPVQRSTPTQVVAKQVSHQTVDNLVPLPKETVLNEQQKLAKRLIAEKKKIFLTGSAGTGKSFTLRQIIEELRNKYGFEGVGITSTTGIGATLIDGTTLHSYLGIGVMGNHPKEIIKIRIFNSYKAISNWKKTKALIIDEVSMLSGELFTKLNQIAKEIKNKDQPFGGIQLVLVGDFCQLLPVEEEIKYIFETDAWESVFRKGLI